jgi:hypothetical protein
MAKSPSTAAPRLGLGGGGWGLRARVLRQHGDVHSSRGLQFRNRTTPSRAPRLGGRIFPKEPFCDKLVHGSPIYVLIFALSGSAYSEASSSRLCYVTFIREREEKKNADLFAAVPQVTKALWAAGLAAQCVTQRNQTLAAQICAVRRKGGSFMVLVAGRELQLGKYVLKTLATKQQEVLSLEEICQRLCSLIYT